MTQGAHIGAAAAALEGDGGGRRRQLQVHEQQLRHVRRRLEVEGAAGGVRAMGARQPPHLPLQLLDAPLQGGSVSPHINLCQTAHQFLLLYIIAFCVSCVAPGRRVGGVGVSGGGVAPMTLSVCICIIDALLKGGSARQMSSSHCFPVLLGACHVQKQCSRSRNHFYTRRAYMTGPHPAENSCTGHVIL